VLPDHLPAQHAAGVAQEVLEQRVLPGRELDPPLAASDLPGRGIDREIVDPEGGRPVDVPPSQQRADAGEEFLERERLGDSRRRRGRDRRPDR